MRILLSFCICFVLAECSALAFQQSAPQLTVPPVPQLGIPQQRAPQQGTPQQRTPQQRTPQQGTPQQGTPQQASPPPDPFVDDPVPSQPDNLDLDSNRAFNFNDSANTPFSNTPFSNPSDFQSSVASNSNFNGASPQMIGDFGGGSSILTLGAGVGADPINNIGAWSNMLTTPIPLAGGSRRIKVAENNQVMPTDRWYGTVNYFHNAYQAIGTEGNDPSYPVTVVESESLVQYTVGGERTFCLWGSPFSFDVRMPFTGGVHQLAESDGAAGQSGLTTDTGHMGNLSTTLKAYLLEFKQTSISGGLGVSLPTGSDVKVAAGEFVDQEFAEYSIDINNNAVHLMPFLGAYRTIGNSCWLQAFTQIDVATNGNDVRILEERFDQNGNFLNAFDDRLRLKEQTLLYADVSFGKWWYRNICECGDPRCRGGRRGLTGVASVLELHYTSSLNDAKAINLGEIPRVGSDYQFDILNMTTGLQFELNQELRINLAAVFPLRDGRFDSGGRREDRGFDSEFALQVNYLY